jgi:carbonic anhydrase
MWWFRKMGFVVVVVGVSIALAEHGPQTVHALKPEQAWELLKEGNSRFAEGKGTHPHCDAKQLALAAAEDQTNRAYATVLSCSDSRVPVEIIFDSGVMDVFVVRIAGNICRTDEIGSIEYGLAHVKTPLLVVLGHSKCGAVKAAVELLEGQGHELEAGVVSIVKSIAPAVSKAHEAHGNAHGTELIAHAVEENVWNSISQLFQHSPTVCGLVRQGKVKVVGGVYDLGSHRVEWLPEDRVKRLLGEAEAGHRQ